MWGKATRAQESENRGTYSGATANALCPAFKFFIDVNWIGVPEPNHLATLRRWRRVNFNPNGSFGTATKHNSLN